MGGIVMVNWEDELIREVINIKCWEVCLEFSVQRFNGRDSFLAYKVERKGHLVLHGINFSCVPLSRDNAGPSSQP